MKAGIITFHFALNYGAMFQVYALKRTLEKLGIEVKVIDYIPEAMKHKYTNKLQLNSKDSIKRNIKKTGSFALNYIDIKKKINKFEEFRKENLNLTQDIEELDYLFIGSDQVWNPLITSGFDEHYFGVFDTTSNENLVKVSYAPSFGVSELSNEQKTKLKGLIKKINHISVREEQGKSILKDVEIENVQVVLDPTLLITKQEWEQIAKTDTVKEKYLLLYRLENNEQMIKAAKKVARKNGWKIKEVTGKRPFKKLSKNHEILVDKGPEEMIGLIKNSEFIITNSFHGTVFSIIFNKNFYTYSHSTVPSRMINILRKFQLNERLLDYDEDLKEISNIDFTSTNKVLEEYKEQSLNFIKTSIKNKVY